MIFYVGVQTGLGVAVPGFKGYSVDSGLAFGTALVWAEASVYIAVIDVIITNILDIRNSP